MATGAPSFSYAQAAKGVASQSPSTPPSKPNSTSDTTEPMVLETRWTNPEVERQSSLPNGEMHHDLESKAATPTSSIKPVNSQVSTKAELASKSDADLSQPLVPNWVQTAAPSVSSAIGVDGPARDDPGTLTPNESESAWERVSQPSQSDTKSTSKPESDNGDSKLSSWEHVPLVNQLKEAPLPAFNIWHKRAADARIKAQESKPNGAAAQPSTVDATTTSIPKKTGDSTIDSTVKRKTTSTRHNGDDRSLQLHRENGGGSGASQAPASKMASVPPPPTDAMSWPTPENAKEEEKKKAYEKTERLDKPDPEKTPNKHHGKEKWVQMPYVPTAVFNTPLPNNRRGGRAGRGGRDGSGRGNSASATNGGDRSQTAMVATVATTVPSSAGPRVDAGTSRPGPLPSKGKRASSAGPSIAADSRRNGEESNLKSSSNPRPAPADGRRVTSGQQTDSRQWSPGGRIHGPEMELGFRAPSAHQDSVAARNGSDRRNESRPVVDSDGHGTQRERSDGRSDRGRGGYRGRGNFSNTSGNPNVSAQAYAPPPNMAPSFTPTKSQSYSSDPRRESMPVGSLFPNSREPRHSRNNSRSQSIPTTTYGRYPAGAQHLPQLHTESANMFYPQGHPGVVSAVPYPGYMEHLQLVGLVQMQMEYYFSVDNLCKDMFLRRHMDSQGFVFLEVLLNFNRIKQLTQDSDLIRFVCFRSLVIELLTGNDGIDRVRRRGDWQQWVMSKDDRDPSVRNDGPPQLHVPQQQQLMLQFADPKTMAMANMPKTAHPGAHFRPESLILNEGYPPSGHNTEAPATTTPIIETPLSAAVPDFTPSMQTAPNFGLQQSPGLITQEFPNGSIDPQRGSSEAANFEQTPAASNGAVHGQVFTEK